MKSEPQLCIRFVLIVAQRDVGRWRNAWRRIFGQPFGHSEDGFYCHVLIALVARPIENRLQWGDRRL